MFTKQSGMEAKFCMIMIDVKQSRSINTWTARNLGLALLIVSCECEFKEDEEDLIEHTLLAAT